FLVNGNLAVSASGKGGVLVRVDPAQTDKLVRRPHASVAIMGGRALEGWLRVAPDGVRTNRQLETWTTRGVDYAKSLPPKRKEERSGATELADRRRASADETVTVERHVGAGHVEVRGCKGPSQ